MHVELLCGTGTVGITLPDRVRELSIKPYVPLADPPAAVAEALARPITGPPLLETARGRKNACIVISDITRPVPNRVILPPLLAVLEEAGLPRDCIVILIATGMHRPNLDAELERLVGPDIVRDYRVENHYCRLNDDMVRVGELDGAPIELNRLYVEADLKILTGLIEPHMYAGFSGRGKSILPGISSFQTMRYMHSFKMIADPGVRNCNLEGNPFHEAVEQVTGLVGADFLLNVVISKDRDLAGVFAGEVGAAHREGCRLVEEHTVHHLDGPQDLVITSGGGFPLDATFYQVSKGLIAARDMLKPGGSIVAVCGCREGLGSPEYANLIREARAPQDFFGHYCKLENFTIDQWCLQTTYQSLAHAAHVHVYAPGLAAADLAGLGIFKINDVQETVDRLLTGHEKAVVVPEGPYVVGLVG